MLIADTEEELLSMAKRLQDGMESKGLRVNISKTKVMNSVRAKGAGFPPKNENPP